MIDNYKQEHDASTKRDQTFVTSYIINVIASFYFLGRSLVGSGWINQLQPGWRMLAGVLVGLMSVNIYFLLSKVDWKTTSRSTKVGAIMTFVVVAAFLFRLDTVSLPKSSYQFGVGLAMALLSGYPRCQLSKRSGCTSNLRNEGITNGKD